ncbi:FUSC family protein [Winogradskyella costae]|uniref:FUSC family protein n=1 Tax=Winogradskyella costae TaxID=2697008 RepID=UPI0015CD36F3|nr:FUSC family protein [Winogradskyella costae]
MKKSVIILGLIAAIVAVTLSASPYSNFAMVPIIIAFITGLALVFISKKEQVKPKPIQYIFLLVIMSIGLTIYKGVYNSIEEEEEEAIEHRSENEEEDSSKPMELLDDRPIE